MVIGREKIKQGRGWRVPGKGGKEGLAGKVLNKDRRKQGASQVEIWGEALLLRGLGTGPKELQGGQCAGSRGSGSLKASWVVFRTLAFILSDMGRY